MAAEWGDIRRGNRRFQEVRSRVHLLWSHLFTLLGDGRPVDEGLELADSLLFTLDELLADCLDGLQRGGAAALLDRGAELIRMQRRVFVLVERFIAEVTDGLALTLLTRRSRDTIHHSRMLLEHARSARIVRLAS